MADLEKESLTVWFGSWHKVMFKMLPRFLTSYPREKQQNWLLKVFMVGFFPLNIPLWCSLGGSGWPLLWLFTACRGNWLWLWSVALVSDVWVCFIYSAEPRCRCAGLFHGTRCELPDNPCASKPCAHGRVCIPKPQGYMCNCSLDNAEAR